MAYLCASEADADFATKPEKSETSQSPGQRHVVLVEHEGPEYDSRRALRFRRGLLDPRAAAFRRSILENKDMASWNVRCRVLGGGGDYFFPLMPSLVVRRPVPRVFLNLRTSRQSAWTQRLPPQWRDIDIRIAFSQDFIEEVGLRNPLYLRSELQDQLGREEFNAHVAKLDMPGHHLPLMHGGALGHGGGQTHTSGESRHDAEYEPRDEAPATEIVHKSVTPEGIEVRFEYRFRQNPAPHDARRNLYANPLRRAIESAEGGGSQGGAWLLDDVCVVVATECFESSARSTTGDVVSTAATARAYDEEDGPMEAISVALSRMRRGGAIPGPGEVEIHAPQRGFVFADGSQQQRMISELMGTGSIGYQRRQPLPLPEHEDDDMLLMDEDTRDTILAEASWERPQPTSLDHGSGRRQEEFNRTSTNSVVIAPP